MPSKSISIADGVTANQPTRFELGGFVHTITVRNRSATLQVEFKLDQEQDFLALKADESYSIFAEDTSDRNAAKIQGTALLFTNSSGGAVTVDLRWTLKGYADVSETMPARQQAVQQRSGGLPL